MRWSPFSPWKWTLSESIRMRSRSVAYRLAFSGSAPNYGFAAAVSVIIFLLVALMSIPGFRRTKALEEIN